MTRKLLGISNPDTTTNTEALLAAADAWRDHIVNDLLPNSPEPIAAELMREAYRIYCALQCPQAQTERQEYA